MIVPCHHIQCRKIGNPLLQKKQTSKMHSTARLSVNLNKVALIRNSRGSNLPNLVQVALDCEKFGAEGITVHPRPDQRHIRFDDIESLKAAIATELNIEGNPTQEFMDLVLQHRPAQCTLVPDSPSQLTSDSGWDTVKQQAILTDIIKTLHDHDIRVSVFVDPVKEMVIGAKQAGADRIELYTGVYAAKYHEDREKVIQPFMDAALVAKEVEIGVNAGHDLNLQNLHFFAESIPNLLEVSIGHALISDALYYGLGNVIPMYRHLLRVET
jgi:pyridoxine 5-phosphate synthase